MARHLPAGESRHKLVNVAEMLSTLERGLTLTRFTPKRAPERKVFRMQLETRELLRLKHNNDKGIQVVVDLRHVKEIRVGQNSTDFDKWQQEAKDQDPSLCFVVLYGSEFNLKTLSGVANNAEEFQIWMQGLEHLVQDTQNSPYPAMIERWLRKEFRAMENKMHVLTNKELKNWMPKIYLKPGNRLKEICQEVDPGMKDINFDTFCKIYHGLVHQHTIFLEHFRHYFNDGKVLTPEDFAMFLKYEQKDPIGDDSTLVRHQMARFLEITGTQRNPTFKPTEFLDYLFSKENTVWDSRNDKVNQDMTQPLSRYWISSSHNTYLTGDQFSSESSCEAYIRVLRTGCRCIELDCWDGDKEPVIYHGHTLTSKISFTDVLKVIRDHAWDVSEYPLILSIENHCSLVQQRFMANSFRKIFGDRLLTEPISMRENELPSPNALRKKIILKHKKLPEGGDGLVTVYDDYTTDDLSQAKKTGILYMEDPVDLKWRPHYFVLTTSKLVFSDETNTKDEDEDLDEEEVSRSEKWFHGIMERDAANELLQEWGPKLGDGTFLVRRRVGSQEQYSLSFWRQGKINHCLIETTRTNGEVQYQLIPNNMFSNINTLIEYHQAHALHTREFHQILKNPVPKEGSHTRDEWFHDPLSREDAIDMLSRIPYDGAYLIRRRAGNGAEYAASFRAEGKIKHCRINQDTDGHYIVGTAEFESLEDLVEYFSKYPLYRKCKFHYPVNKDIVARVGTRPDEQSIYTGSVYIAPNEYTSDIQAHALYNYTGKRSDELSFKKDDIIINVNKVYKGWWRGDLGNNKQHWFPMNHVEEIEMEDSSPLGSLQQGEVKLQGCSIVHLRLGAGEHFPFRFRITNQTNQQLTVACHKEEELKDWIQTIRQCIMESVDRVLSARSRKQLEKKMKLARELSDLIIYCQTVDFEPEKGGPAYEMSSLPEPKAEKWCLKNPSNAKVLLSYNKIKFSRVYPKGVRIDSSNYDPMPMWVAGCHMVALNYQTPDHFRLVPEVVYELLDLLKKTPEAFQCFRSNLSSTVTITLADEQADFFYCDFSDRSMQLNEGLFALNGRSGYILKPESMSKKPFNPLDGKLPEGVEPLTVSITILGARHLTKTGRGIPSPFVEVEIVGSKFDAKHNTFKTSTKVDNGLNPVWHEACEFDVSNPDLSLVRFIVQDEDMFGDPNFLGQAVFTVKALRSGYRSVALQNGYSEELPLAALLIHVDLTNPEEEYEEIYTGIVHLRSETDRLEAELEEVELTGDDHHAQQIKSRLKNTKAQLSERNQERRAKKQQKKAKVVGPSGKRKGSRGVTVK